MKNQNRHRQSQRKFRGGELGAAGYVSSVIGGPNQQAVMPHGGLYGNPANYNGCVSGGGRKRREMKGGCGCALNTPTTVGGGSRGGRTALLTELAVPGALLYAQNWYGRRLRGRNSKNVGTRRKSGRRLRGRNSKNVGTRRKSYSRWNRTYMMAPER